MTGGLWTMPPDDWPEGVPWPPPLFPHPQDAWRIRGWAGGRELAERMAEARRALLVTAPAEGCYPP